MRLNRILLLGAMMSVFSTGCGGGGSNGSGSTPSVPQDSNVLSITVNGSLCSNTNSYLNKACVSVTVCEVNTSTCQAINDILLDTGSSGLRIFKQALTAVDLSRDQVLVDSGSLAECIQYGDGSSHWGPVQMASIILGGEPAVQLPVQVIDSTFGARPTACEYADTSPSEARFNGILGISQFIQDCGPACVNSAANGIYYECNGLTCSQTAVPLASQVQNPVAILSADGNGFYVQFPSISSGGAYSVTGYLVLGIGTRTNNTPSAVTTYPVNEYGEFKTSLPPGISYISIADTGSNGLFFDPLLPGQMPDCTGYPGWYCPASTISFDATNYGISGSPSGSASFQIGNFANLYSSGKSVFGNIGGNDIFGSFDWGLPFFLGRTVYIGIEGRSSNIGTGPYIAY